MKNISFLETTSKEMGSYKDILNQLAQSVKDEECVKKKIERLRPRC